MSLDFRNDVGDIGVFGILCSVFGPTFTKKLFKELAIRLGSLMSLLFTLRWLIELDDDFALIKPLIPFQGFFILVLQSSKNLE